MLVDMVPDWFPAAREESLSVQTLSKLLLVSCLLRIPLIKASHMAKLRYKGWKNRFHFSMLGEATSLEKGVYMEQEECGSHFCKQSTIVTQGKISNIGEALFTIMNLFCYELSYDDVLLNINYTNF